MNGENVILHFNLVRYQLDMLNKEWNQIGDAIKNKKKANKADPCAEELEQKKVNEQKQKEKLRAFLTLEGVTNFLYQYLKDVKFE